MVAHADTVLYIEGHRKWYIASLVVSAVLFLWAATTVHQHPLASWELRLLLDVNHEPDHWRELALAVSAIGGSAWTAIITVGASYLLKLYRLTWRLAISFLLCAVLVYVAEHLVSQPQIAAIVPGLEVRAVSSGLAFPSGTAAVAAVITLSLLPYFRGYWRILLPLWVLVVAVTRLYLGVQTPLDILGGLALGVFLVSLIRITPQTVRVALRLD